jgi:large subunit ribosomal protein L14
MFVATRQLGSRLAASLPALPSLPQAFRCMSIHRQTRLSVIDNSGANEVMCIDYIKGYGRPAKLGDAIRVVVKSARSDGRVSRKDILGAVVVRQRARHQRADGSTVFFQENAAVLMKRDFSGPIGTRVSGPVARELRQGKFMKIVLMASKVL